MPFIELRVSTKLFKLLSEFPKEWINIGVSSWLFSRLNKIGEYNQFDK